MPEMGEELREQVNELLGEPNEAVVDALLVYATNKVAHIAGAALTARWRAEDELTEARGELGRLRNRITALEANGSELLARAERAEAIVAALPDPSTAEELREKITELLGSPDEALLDAFLGYAWSETARIAGGEMTARWQAETDLAEMKTIATERSEACADAEAEVERLRAELDEVKAERDAKLRTKALGRSLVEMEGFAQRETARADKAEYDLEIRTHTARSNAKAHRIAYLESEKQRERAEAAEAERDALTTELGHAHGTLSDTRQEVDDLTDENRQLRDERDLLRETLAESDLGCQVLAQWEAIAAADVDRDRLEANGSELLARAERAEAEEERMRATPVDWDAQRRRADGLEAERDALNAELAALSANWMRRAGNIMGANEGETFPDLLAIRGARAGVLRDCTRDLLAALRTPESNADAPSPVTAATEAHGEAGRAEEAGESLLDPDCRDGKHGSCVGGPCECPHHTHTPIGDPGEPDEGPYCEACGDHWPCREMTAAQEG